METQVMLERAGLLLEQGRYQDAEKHIKQVLEQEPDNDHALSVLARCYLNSKRYELGLDTIRQAIAINPNESFYFYLLAFGEYQRDMNLAAIANLQKAIELNPYVAEYFGMVAYVLIGEKNFEAALEKANQGLALEADNLTCLNARSTALNKLRRTDDAIETMNAALERDPENETTHATIGWNLLERGRHQEAREHFMEALRIDPNHSAARAGLKEALKSRLLLYKWLLQYSFWVSNKGRNFQVALPIVLYIAFRVMIEMSKGSKSSDLTWILVGIYIFILVISWTIGSIANFVLLFHRLGKHALSNTEKWSAINAVSALASGITILLLTDLAAGTDYESGIFFIGLVCLSLALPLGHLEYPVQWKGRDWKESFGLYLSAFGLLTVLVFTAAPAAAAPLFVIYGIAFLIYNWAGLAN